MYEYTVGNQIPRLRKLEILHCFWAFPFPLFAPDDEPHFYSVKLAPFHLYRILKAATPYNLCIYTSSRNDLSRAPSNLSSSAVELAPCLWHSPAYICVLKMREGHTVNARLLNIPIALLGIPFPHRKTILHYTTILRGFR
jgi:hypothetical protein